ncbi:hypothetical protein ACIBCM_05140 [Streptomyces sp. NPDC051018]|uniref:hypothetical protein n=1 Tax=Streptomyces sp. NPDC051018 TaxID=3365639 RepID=UPI00378A7F25
MRAIRAASAALLGAAALALPALALSAPPAAASEDGKATVFSVNPSTVAPGGRVTLSANACTTTATASSGVFDTVTIRPGTTVTATVDPGARRGAQYAVQFTCGSQRGTVNLTIAGATSSPTTSSTVTPQGVRGGLGGSVGGVGAREVAVGGALVVAAATATGFVVVRRRAHIRQH